MKPKKINKNYNIYEPILEKITFEESQLQMYLYQKLHEYFELIKNLDIK